MKKTSVKICGYEFKFSAGQLKFIELRQKLCSVYYEAYHQAAKEFFTKFQTIDDILKEGTAWFGALIIKPVADTVIAFLIKEKHYDLTVEGFIDKCIDLREWNEAIDAVIQKKIEIEQTEEERENERSARTQAAGSAWVGGGFGIEGAVKGALKAECLNLAGAAISGVFNGVGRFFSVMANAEAERNFVKSQETRELFLVAIAGVYASALTNTVTYAQQNGIRLEKIPYDYDKRDNLLKNVQNGVVPDEDVEECIIRALECDFFDTEPYRLLLERFGDEDGSIQKTADFFGVSLVKVKAILALTELFNSWELTDVFDVVVARKILREKAVEMGYTDYTMFIPLEQAYFDLLYKENYSFVINPGGKKVAPEKVKQLKKQVSFFKHCCDDDTCYCFPYIPEEKLQGAKKHFIADVDDDDVLCLADMTIFGGCQEGFAVTKDAFYAIEHKEIIRIALSEIKSVTALEDHSLTYIYVNRKKIAHWCKGEELLQKFITAVCEYAKFVQKTTPGKFCKQDKEIEDLYNSLKIQDYFDCLAARDMLQEKADSLHYEDYITHDPLEGILESYRRSETPDQKLFPTGTQMVDVQKVRLWQKRLACFEAVNDARFSKLPSIKSELLQSAISSFAPDAKEDDVIALLDNTLFGNGSKGVLVTKNCIYGGECDDGQRKYSLLEPITASLEIDDNDMANIYINDEFLYKFVVIENNVVENFVTAINQFAAFNLEYKKRPYISIDGKLYKTRDEAEVQEKLQAHYETMFADIDTINDSLEQQEEKALQIRGKLFDAAQNLKMKNYKEYAPLEEFIVELDVKIRTVNGKLYETREEAAEARKVYELEKYFSSLKKDLEKEENLEKAETKAIATRDRIKEKQKSLQLTVTETYAPLEDFIVELDVKIRTVNGKLYETREEAAEARRAYEHLKLLEERKNKYILCAVFLGFLGVHDFYAGKKIFGFIKLAITLFSEGSLVWVSFIWAVIDIFIACNKESFFDADWKKK